MTESPTTKATAATTTIAITSNDRPMIEGGGALLSERFSDDLSNHKNPSVQASAHTMMRQ